MRTEAQVIVCKCGSVIAACVAPECFQEKEWMKDVRDYSKKGYTIEMRETGQGNLSLKACTCKLITNQLSFA